MKIISGSEWKQKYARVGYKTKTTEQIIGEIVTVMEGALAGQVGKRSGSLWQFDTGAKTVVVRIPYGARTLCAVTDLDAKSEDEAKKRFGEVIEKIKGKDKAILSVMVAGIEEVKGRMAKAREIRGKKAA